ncbi:tRNA (adenosine(37)-N6)-dimethylallyltransferase MiaA [Paracoccus suum]|uniref:tRNA dimethylallyltransferase n=2 Tax=Paracoccus suum TaxID=2259340 RepID=A0A344PP20_9RHOB|nr:tRNA (adenosine(37)-N6)-dimethylallyltransferase MiaA [Paracoccus suum]AXC51125.1 tRNA (adenosine(37)-N6)-dimethylallyltransferase MiaA [Paracoccus suum]
MTVEFAPLIAGLDPARHVLIAGPTAAGKSALALAISRAQGGLIVNADALQVWSCWRVLTARPSVEDEAAAPHRLYGHVAPGTTYSVGTWLAEIAELLAGGERLIIAGGTGLYLTALTEGLAVIPPVPPEVRAEADRIRLGPDGLANLLSGVDAGTVAGLDRLNPMRVQRAWEVLRATGRGLADWQADTPPPLIDPAGVHRLVLQADRDRLAARIEGRFDAMLTGGALAEVAALRPIWQPQAQWARAIGAAELLAHLRGETSLADAREAAIIATRRYAKAQRSWFRNRMGDWTPVPVEV